MDNLFELKSIYLLKKEGSLMTQEESNVFLLSMILEDFIMEHENEPRFELEVAFATRLDHFLLDDEKTTYYEA